MKMLKSLKEFEQEGSSMNRAELIQIKGGSTQSRYGTTEINGKGDTSVSSRRDGPDGQFGPWGSYINCGNCSPYDKVGAAPGSGSNIP
jgi:hypothetical protein